MPEKAFLSREAGSPERHKKPLYQVIHDPGDERKQTIGQINKSSNILNQKIRAVNK